MTHQTIQIRIKAAMCFTSLQWRNQMRCFFERWAMVIAHDHCVLLEDLSRSEPIWNWYQAQFTKVEEQFYKQNRIYINSLGDEASNELFEVFELLAYQLEESFPITLINNLKTNGKTTIN